MDDRALNVVVVPAVDAMVYPPTDRAMGVVTVDCSVDWVFDALVLVLPGEPSATSSPGKVDSATLLRRTWDPFGKVDPAI
jgi:hypothetical protein